MIVKDWDVHVLLKQIIIATVTQFLLAGEGVIQQHMREYVYMMMGRPHFLGQSGNLLRYDHSTPLPLHLTGLILPNFEDYTVP